LSVRQRVGWDEQQLGVAICGINGIGLSQPMARAKPSPGEG
jgi:hypothetical protein